MGRGFYVAVAEWLLLTIFFLILLSGFFSGAEIAMMSLNRYRLRHLVRQKNRKAEYVAELLERTDRLLGVILIGNTFTNILASALTTLLAACHIVPRSVRIYL